WSLICALRNAQISRHDLLARSRSSPALAAGPPTMPIALFALAIASFGIGTTEFVIMGLLPEVAADLGVSIPSAGLLITGYALGVVVGGPIIVVATAR